MWALLGERASGQCPPCVHPAGYPPSASPWGPHSAGHFKGQRTVPVPGSRIRVLQGLTHHQRANWYAGDRVEAGLPSPRTSGYCGELTCQAPPPFLPIEVPGTWHRGQPRPGHLGAGEAQRRCHPHPIPAVPSGRMRPPGQAARKACSGSGSD